MNANIYFEAAIKIYNLFPFKDYTFEKYSEMMKMYAEIKDSYQFLIKMGCSEGFCNMILKTIFITSGYFFKEMNFAEQERLSLEFILLFTINSNNNEFKIERIKYLKIILSLISKKNSNNEITMIDIITNLYLIYCIVETFLGTSIIFFSFLEETQNLLKENKFLKFYDELILSENLTVKIDNLEYEQVQYKDLLVKFIGNDNSSQVFKMLVEFFANKKIEVYSIEDENMEEVILTCIHEKSISINKIDFDKLLDALPQFWNPIVNFKYLLTPN